MAIKKFWNYQAAYPWARTTDGTLTDQSRIWLQTLYRTVVNIDTGGGFTAGGDLSGTNTSQTVIGLEGRPVSATAPTNGQVLTWVSSDSSWEPKTLAAPTVPIVVREAPAGTMDGTNKAFTLSFTPNPAASLTLWLNGVEQVSSFDYTIAGSAINYAVAPKSSDLMVAQYTH